MTMRDTLPPPGEHPTASAPAPTPIQMAGRRSGEGSASVLEHLVLDRIAKKPDSRTQRAQQYAKDAKGT
jgi:hypothetical protein